jgi:hypothetical protein
MLILIVPMSSTTISSLIKSLIQNIVKLRTLGN